jgi:hypothetical protein
MYGHLAYDLEIGEGDRIETGQRIGAVLLRTDGAAPSHLHFEVRTFLTTTEVNGASPRYAFNCGVNCAPGPGYWPMDAPDHPSNMGWRNPTHVIARRATTGSFDVVVQEGIEESAPLWTQPSDRTGAERAGAVQLSPAARLTVDDVVMGPDASTGTSAVRYRLWCRITTEDGAVGWIQAAVSSDIESDSSGQPSAVSLKVVPAA